MLPLKTTIEDLNKLLSYLRTQIGMVDLTKARGALDSKITDNRKLEAAAYVGLIKREGQKIEITTEGRKYATSPDPSEKAAIIAGLLTQRPLYAATIEWMHYTGGSEPVKTAIADYWYKNHETLLEGARGAGLTDAVVFFMRFADAAGLGKYISAGKGRPETYFKGDPEAIESFVLRVPGEAFNQVTTDSSAPMPALLASPSSSPSASPAAVSTAATVVPVASVKPTRSVSVNIEIKIAADASPETIETILKGVSKYVLGKTEEDGE